MENIKQDQIIGPDAYQTKTLKELPSGWSVCMCKGLKLKKDHGTKHFNSFLHTHYIKNNKVSYLICINKEEWLSEHNKRATELRKLYNIKKKETPKILSIGEQQKMDEMRIINNAKRREKYDPEISKIRHKKYRDNNKEILNNKGKEKVVCECGTIISKKYKKKHEENLTHINIIKLKKEELIIPNYPDNHMEITLDL